MSATTSCALRVILAVLLAAALAGSAAGAAGPLPPPRTDGGKPLMQALQERRTSRAFAPTPLPRQLLSDLLWAAAGVNRPDSGRRTAPSARNWQAIDLYAATAEGAFLFDPKAHALVPVVPDDLRAMTGTQPFIAGAPLSLVLVADTARMRGAGAAEREFYAAADAGFISQNIYLFCASEGLATGVRALIDRPALARAMRLRPEQQIVLAQTVGYPK